MKLFFLLMSLLILPQQLLAEEGSAKATYADIEKTLGIVPTFLKQFPERGIEGAWQDMKGIQLNPQTAIPGKYKELMGLAVAAQIPCKYCVYFHTQAALMNGATQEEVKEAVALAACTRRWSTVLNGNQTDEQTFKKEINKMHERMLKQKNMQAMEAKPVVKEMLTAEDAYKDMEMTLGFVPTFLKNYPKSGIVGAWKEMKTIEMNPNSAIPGEYKHLIGVAVSAQIPCTYCSYYHTQSALMMNADKQEIQEAVAVAGITREWSTVLNGMDIDEKKFKAETDKVMKFVKKQSAKEVSSN